MQELRAKALCADRLDLVDDAFTSPGKADALMRLCKRCPIANQCLDLAMRNPEWGVWGGTTPNVRTMHGAASARLVRLRGPH